MGITRVQYSLTVMLWLPTSLNTRTAMKPTAEQKAMCHRVRAMGKGKPLYANTHCSGREQEEEEQEDEEGGGSGSQQQWSGESTQC